MSTAADEANLAQRIERIHSETWPAIETWDYDGWQLRFARGFRHWTRTISLR